MKIQLAVFLLMVMLVVGCGKKPLPASRLIQPKGQFSYVTPEGWFRSKLPGMDFIVVSGPADFGMQPNIFVEGIARSTNAAEVAAELIGHYQSNYPSYSVSNQVVFTTDSGLSGTKVLASRQTREALPLSIFHYVTLDRDRIIQITCSCAQPVVGKYDPIFDAAMKSMATETAAQPLPEHKSRPPSR